MSGRAGRHSKQTIQPAPRNQIEAMTQTRCHSVLDRPNPSVRRWLGSAFATTLILLLGLAKVQAEPPTPLLWQVGDDDRHFYLVGSFHLLTADDYPLADSLEAAYAGAERLVFEISPEEALSPAVATAMSTRGMLPADRSLTSMISPDTRQRLIRFLGSEAALPTVDRLKPWFLTLGIAISAMTQAGFDAQHGLDMHFMQRARSDGKTTLGLETAQQQIDALDSAPIEEQERSLREALRPLPELREEIHTLHRYWRTADLARLEQEMWAELVAETPVSARLLNSDRNRRWLPQLQALIADGTPTLVVVGTLHLVGDDGLPALLTAEGISVRPVGRSTP